MGRTERILLRHIKTCGLAPTKAKNIAALSRLLVERHAGAVPADLDALTALPGVGRKTASVVLAQAFGIPAFPVDTHIHRLAARFGLSDGSNVRKTETDLRRVFSEDAWIRVHLQLIQFGREHCPALRHDMSRCPICAWVASKRDRSRGGAGGSARAAARAPRAKRLLPLPRPLVLLLGPAPRGRPEGPQPVPHGRRGGLCAQPADLGQHA